MTSNTRSALSPTAQRKRDPRSGARVRTMGPPNVVMARRSIAKGRTYLQHDVVVRTAPLRSQPAYPHFHHPRRKGRVSVVVEDGLVEVVGDDARAVGAADAGIGGVDGATQWGGRLAREVEVINETVQRSADRLAGGIERWDAEDQRGAAVVDAREILGEGGSGTGGGGLGREVRIVVEGPHRLSELELEHALGVQQGHGLRG